jgi:hypothetical protein
MISKGLQDKIANATVKISKKEGRGVLVRNQLILTAAHCINFNCEGYMVLGDHFIEEIETINGRLKVEVYAVEPVSDIAVLGQLDVQDFEDENDKFIDFCEKVKPVELFMDKVRAFQKFPVYIYTHQKTWITGEAIKYDTKKNSPSIVIKTHDQIEGGMSGGPVVDKFGRLVAIISHASTKTNDLDLSSGMQPRPHLALPVWLLRGIQKDHDEEDKFTKKEWEKIKRDMINKRI